MTVTGQINYIDRSAPAPTTWYVDPPAGVPIDNVVIDAHDMTISDLRDDKDALDPATLTTVRLTDGFAAFDDDEAVRRDLAPAMAAAARALLGDCLVLPWDHAVRRRPSGPSAFRGSGTLRQPLLRAHCDYTPRSIGPLLRDRLGGSAEALAGQPFMIVNFWRAISGPLRDDPLAICAPESVAAEDLVPIRHVHAQGESEIYGLAHNPAHRWYYMSDMQPDEALFFTQYDSRKPATSCAPHTAFSLRNPTGPVPPRESFEYRLIVFPDMAPQTGVC
ncbi:hypothetical protein CAF53_17450 [Sphingobium sp. LB126]|uniref:CmcJ/NvfI family oxidoreductase n=1 Tax=Sphingobium sp. LB126 TaxID=1983755 RepID=UPI000C2079DD|nr:CmcJ/NvfI family oxidoreductase [Sphingobium sp. LB126]PJG46012.1 hypothetical protein CAF53_17450 [Sphingobium sp. LB126]